MLLHQVTYRRAFCLVDVDHVAEVLVLVVGGVNGLGDVPRHGRIVEIVVDVVHHAIGHALIAILSVNTDSKGKAIVHELSERSIIPAGCATGMFSPGRNRACQRSSSTAKSRERRPSWWCSSRSG